MSKALSSAGKIIKPGCGYTASRKGYSNTRTEDRRHAQQIGTILHAWNRAHAGLFALFRHIVADRDHQLARAMWDTISSDKGQRDTLRAAVKIKMEKSPQLQAAALWSISALDEIGTTRNDAAHSEMVWYYDRMEPGVSVKPASVNRLEKMPIDANWRKITGDLNAIGEYLTIMDLDLATGHKRPSCRRPKLQFVRSKSSAIQERRRKEKLAARERQRQTAKV